MKASDVRAALRALKDPAKAKVMSGFFKTGPGQYGEGDVFLGLTVPQQRAIANKFQGLALPEIEKLLHSKIHEERLTALIMLVEKYRREASFRGAIYKSYVRNFKWINNWDLVDSSAEHITGPWLRDKDRSLLRRWAASKHLWTRRIAMLSTFHYIKNGEHKDAFEIAEMLLGDDEDLMHKAVGWMLRELGKRVSENRLRGFLKKNAARMPRTALRYAIERFGEKERKAWLSR
jgi:3-methyladenine DNA glycosylase AlkD